MIENLTSSSGVLDGRQPEQVLRPEFDEQPESELEPAYKNDEKYSLLAHFLKWYFSDGPKLFWKMIESIITRIYDNFSIEYLFKTLFAPWKRDVLSARNISLQQKMQLSLWNLVSRIVGFVIRSVTILIGIFLTSIISFILLFLYCFWFLIPVAIVILLILIIFSI